MTEQKLSRRIGNHAHAGNGRTSIFAGLTRENLLNDSDLYAWFLRAVVSLNPPVNHTEADLLFVFSTAERCLRCANNPPAMFASLVGKRIDYASNADEELASARLRRMRRRGQFETTAERT